MMRFNVLSALEVINKDRNKISYRGLDTLINTTISADSNFP
jgi:hypothetical protein